MMRMFGLTKKVEYLVLMVNFATAKTANLSIDVAMVAYARDIHVNTTIPKQVRRFLSCHEVVYFAMIT